MLVLRSNTPKTNQVPSIFDQLLTREFPEFFAHTRKFALPNVNIRENDAAYTIELAVPGLNKNDFSITVDEKVLKVAAHKEVEKETTDKIHRHEFSFHQFERSFTLPEHVNVAQIHAEYTNGVLALTVPKQVEDKQSKVKTITIA